ncbi:hypothetical protein BGZ52_003466 [Haplosporangium bisporale]|nr:hypothetical protein BGZ52_003466 [Haplosporangium bisporale]
MTLLESIRCIDLPSNDAIQRLDQAFDLMFNSSPEEYTQLCKEFDPLGGLPRAWLVKGESGSGKTYLVNALSLKHKVPYVATITIGELAVMYPGDIVKGLKTFLGSAQYSSKAVVILDNIELIFPREEGDSAMVYAFQQWMQGVVDDTQHVQEKGCQPRTLVIGLTQDDRGLDPSIQSIFDESIELDVPTPEERLTILRAYMDALCTQAGIVSCQQGGRGLDQVCIHDFEDAMKSIRVSALRQNTSVQKVAPVYWTDIGGLEGVKKILEESVIWLYKHADAYERLGIRPSKGILLYGPPGTGKTLLAKAVATESEANFMAVSIPDLIKGEVGESEKAIAKIFKTATRCSPCIVFLDELEAIFGSRESSGGLGKQLISQLLMEMDSCGKGVVVLAATNHPETIDASILRPGRLDRLAYVPPPTFEERVAILEILRQGTRFSENIDLRTVSNLTMNFTGADLKALVRKAGLYALKANRTNIEAQDFFSATSDVQPSVNQVGLLRYQQFRR